MYYQDYEDYMKSVLGYPIERNNTYELYSNPYEQMVPMYNNPTSYNEEFLDLYPEIYRIINPMVCKICDANTKPISRELIDQMTDEIYSNLEVQSDADSVVNVTVNTPLHENNRNSSNSSNSSSRTGLSTSQGPLQNRTSKEKIKDERNETKDTQREDRQRRPNNRTLRDLIRILILNRLLGETFPNRPPRPRPPRPPMRPPFPRDDGFYENYLRY